MPESDREEYLCIHISALENALCINRPVLYGGLHCEASKNEIIKCFRAGKESLSLPYHSGTYIRQINSLEKQHSLCTRR